VESLAAREETVPIDIRTSWTRRRAIQLLGAGAAGCVHALRGGAIVDAFQAGGAAARKPLTGVPKGVIIRTILEDARPEALGGGATLFHEHMSMNNAFFEKLGKELPPAVMQRLYDPSKPFFMEDMDLMVGEMKAALKDGIACLVDGGTADQGRSV